METDETRKRECSWFAAPIRWSMRRPERMAKLRAAVREQVLVQFNAAVNVGGIADPLAHSQVTGSTVS